MVDDSTSQFWLVLRLLDMPLRVLLEERISEAIIIADKKRVCCLNDAAKKLGICRSMSISRAQAMGQCLVLERNVKKENKALKKLCEACYAITPYIETSCMRADGIGVEYSIFLEVSRCVKLFSSLNCIETLVLNLVTQNTLHVEQAFGHTAQAAYLMTYLPACKRVSVEHLLPSDYRKYSLNCLYYVPLEVVLNFPNEINALKKMGFSVIGDLFDPSNNMSIRSIRKRFSTEFCQYLEEVLASDGFMSQASIFQSKPSYYQQENSFFDSFQCEYPIVNLEYLLIPLTTLLEKLSLFLCQYQLETQIIDWSFSSIAQEFYHLPIQFDRMHRQCDFALKLSMIKLESEGLPFEVDVVELRCDHLIAVEFTEENAFIDRSHPGQQPQDLSLSLAKLRTRMGDDAIYALGCEDNHVPELSSVKLGISEAHTSVCSMGMSHRYSARPTWIFPQPVYLPKRQSHFYWYGKVSLLNGPERIETAWWHLSVARDYYVAIREDSIRLWVFYDIDEGAWYVHGIFG